VLDFLSVQLEFILECLGFGLQMIYRLGHKLIDFIKLAREFADELFLLLAHLMCGKMPNPFDIFLDLCSEFAEEFVGRVYLLLQIFFRTTDSGKRF